MKDVSEEIAKKLLEVKAVQFSLEKPFKWSSGWNSPIYCDCRLTLSYPQVRSFIKDSFVELIKTHYPQVETIAGVATAGIPQSALIADAMDLPLIYVRAKAKEHGKENLIEGKINAGQKVVLIEDIISTGGSSLQAVEALQSAGFEVLGVVAILTYGFDFATQQFQDAGIRLDTLSDYTKLLVEVFKSEGVSEKTMASLHEWRKNPQKWQAD